MNKKLLCSTALAGALIVSGSALAELKIGGNITHTTSFGKDDSSSTANGSGERLGTEMNLVLSSKQDLKNGMYMSYKANIEWDDVGNAPDVEYELQLGQGNFYIGAGSDSGNNLSAAPTLPAVGYHVGSLARMVSTSDPLNYDPLLNAGEANDKSHLSVNYKTMGGTASIIWAPNATTDMDDDQNKINSSGGASRLAYLYQGSPVANVNFIIGRSVETGDSDTAANEKTNDKAGISYNFGQIQAGYEYQKYKTGSDSEKERADNYAITFKASDSLTLGVQHSRSKNDALANANTEKLTALSAGYNLGPASIAVALVDVENLGSTATAGVDSQGIVITTKMGF